MMIGAIQQHVFYMYLFCIRSDSFISIPKCDKFPTN